MINFKFKLWQDDHIFEKLNSLSFQDILNVFPEQLKREKLDECIFVGDHVTYFHFPWVFHVFQVCGHPVWGE